MQSETIIGKKRRYHIDALMATGSTAYVYRAFARRRTRKGIVRRYYALVAPTPEKGGRDFTTTIDTLKHTLPFPVRLEEIITTDDGRLYILAKGLEVRSNNTLAKLTNKGYLMILLSLLILILLIVI